MPSYARAASGAARTFADAEGGSLTGWGEGEGDAGEGDKVDAGGVRGGAGEVGDDSEDRASSLS